MSESFIVIAQFWRKICTELLWKTNGCNLTHIGQNITVVTFLTHKTKLAVFQEDYQWGLQRFYYLGRLIYPVAWVPSSGAISLFVITMCACAKFPLAEWLSITRQSVIHETNGSTRRNRSFLLRFWVNLGFIAIKAIKVYAIKPSSHQAIKPSSHQAIKPSKIMFLISFRYHDAAFCEIL